MTPRHHSLIHGGTISIKDTSRRIHLALARAFLVRWVVAWAVRNLLLTGLLIGSVIAPLALSGAATPQTMLPKDNASSSPIEVKDEMGRFVRIPQPVRRIVSLAPSV